VRWAFPPSPPPPSTLPPHSPPRSPASGYRDGGPAASTRPRCGRGPRSGRAPLPRGALQRGGAGRPSARRPTDSRRRPWPWPAARGRTSSSSCARPGRRILFETRPAGSLHVCSLRSQAGFSIDLHVPQRSLPPHAGYPPVMAYLVSAVTVVFADGLLTGRNPVPPAGISTAACPDCRQNWCTASVCQTWSIGHRPVRITASSSRGHSVDNRCVVSASSAAYIAPSMPVHGCTRRSVLSASWTVK